MSGSKSGNWNWFRTGELWNDIFSLLEIVYYARELKLVNRDDVIAFAK